MVERRGGRRRDARPAAPAADAPWTQRETGKNAPLTAYDTPGPANVKYTHTYVSRNLGRSQLTLSTFRACIIHAYPYMCSLAPRPVSAMVSAMVSAG